jgi:hypothetical protein
LVCSIHWLLGGDKCGIHKSVALLGLPCLIDRHFAEVFQGRILGDEDDVTYNLHSDLVAAAGKKAEHPTTNQERPVWETGTIGALTGTKKAQRFWVRPSDFVFDDNSYVSFPVEIEIYSIDSDSLFRRPLNKLEKGRDADPKKSIKEVKADAVPLRNHIPGFEQSKYDR